MELNNQIELMNAEVMDIVTKGVDSRDSRERIEEMCKAHYEKISKMQNKLAAAKVKGQKPCKTISSMIYITMCQKYPEKCKIMMTIL